MELKVTKTILNIGIEKELKLLHITDTHTCLVYESEGEDRVILSKRRYANAFNGEGVPEMYLEKALEYAKQNDDLIAYTGDVYDFISKANLDLFDRTLAYMDYIYS